MNKKYTRWICVIICIGLLSIPCAAHKKKGHIYVDKPEVFTRERLINERAKEREWLTKMLDNYKFSYQGILDIKSFSGFFAGIQASLDTLSAIKTTREQKVADIEQQVKIEDIQKQQEINNLNHQIEVLKLQQTIKELNETNKTGETGASVAGDTNKNENNQKTGNTGGIEAENSESQSSSLFKDASVFGSQNKSDYPNFKEIGETKAKLTSLEALKDEKSYRDQVRAMIRETELDDVHEINGSTLYTLKFDVTVDLPEEKKPNPAKVELTLLPQKMNINQYADLYKSWSAKFEKDIKSQAISLRNQLKLKYLTDSEFEYVKIYLDQEAKKQQENLKNQQKNGKTKRESINKELENIKKTLESLKNQQKIGETEWEDLKKVRENLEEQKKIEETEREDLKKTQKELENLKLFLAGATPIEEIDLSLYDEIFYNYILAHYKTLNEKYIIFSAYSKNLSWIYSESISPMLLNHLEKILKNSMEKNDTKIFDDCLPQLIIRFDSSINILGKNTSFSTATDNTKNAEIESIFDSYVRKIIKSDSSNNSEERILSQAEVEKNKIEITDNVYWKMVFNRNFLNFLKVLRELEQETPYVYVVEPKEYAQNISYVEANEKMTNLMFMLDALFQTKGAGLKAYMESLKERQEQMHSILREPLVVGYADGSDNFGWLLGPRFQLGKKNQPFSYTKVQYSLQASIVVPCWFNEISISKKCYYGKHELKDTKSREEIPPTFKHIRLNPDISMITAALLGREGSYRQPPSLEPKLYTIRPDTENEQLLIHGDHLWKNPEVFIGNKKAESVILMPDMRTIHATFNTKFPSPKDDEADGTKVNLTVITSDGSATIKGGVIILPPTKKEESPQKPSVKLISLYTWPNHELKLLVSAELLPKNKLLKLHIRKKGAELWLPCLTEIIEENAKKNFVELTFKELDDFYKPGETKESMEICALLEITDTMSNQTKILQVDGSCVYFKDKNATELTLNNYSKDIQIIKVKEKCKTYYSINKNIVMEFENPPLFFKAYPDLLDMLKGNLKIQFITQKVDCRENIQHTLTIDNNVFSYAANEKNTKGKIEIDSDKFNSKQIPALEKIVPLIQEMEKKSRIFTLKIQIPGQLIKVNGDLSLKMM